MAKKDCVERAVKRGVSRERAEHYRDQIMAGRPDSAAWKARAERLKAEQEKLAAAAEKRAQVNVARRVNAIAHVNRAKAEGKGTTLGVQSLLIGTNTPFTGSRMSATAAIEGYEKQILSTFRRDLGKENEALLASRQKERSIALELAELNDNKGNGKPGITNDPVALHIAKAIKTAQDMARELVNKNGADVGQLNRYIARTDHSPERLISMGEQGWIKLVRDTADLAKTYGADNAAHWDEMLSGTYKKLSTGDHSDVNAPEDMFLVKNMNIAKQLSQSRVIHFKDAESWYRYQQEAASSDVTTRWLKGFQGSARDAGIMSVLGTNPLDNLGRIVKTLKDAATTPEERVKIDREAPKWERWVKVMTGDANRITNKGAALATQNYLTLQRTAKLGFLPFSQFADLATVMSELRYQGVDFPRRILGPLGAYFQGEGSQQREVAKLVGGAVEGWLAEIQHTLGSRERFDAELGGGPVTAGLSAIQNFMFKVTGATTMTNRGKEAGVYLMARHWGEARGMPWEGLNDAERRIMGAFEIGPSEWRALNAATQWSDVQGSQFLTPSVVNDIPAADMQAWKSAVGREKLTDDQARDVLATRLWRYYADREKYALLDLGTRERSIGSWGGPSDTKAGAAWRAVFQFKSFMTAMIGRTWGREINGGQGATGAVYGIVEFAAVAGVLGTISTILRDVATGTDPFHRFHEDPRQYLAESFARGGAMGPAGDFLFAEQSRHGQNFTSWALGPAGGIIDAGLAVKSQIAEGKPFATTAIQLAKSNLPTQNLLYTKAVLDRLIWMRLMDWVEPGYSQRLATSQRQKGVRSLLEVGR